MGSGGAQWLSLDLLLLKRFFSFSLFLLLDEPQPRKTNGEGHHHDQDGVLYHRSCPELMTNRGAKFRNCMANDTF
jgi:hypothetical protein